MFAKKPADTPPDLPYAVENSNMRAATSLLPKSAVQPAAVDGATSYADGGNAEGVVIIGKGTRIAGEITNCTRLEIQGAVEGRISAVALVVRDGGSVNGEIYAENAEINGIVQGHLDVKGLLDIRSTGRVEGDLAYGRLAVAMGGHIAGQIKNADQSIAAEPANEQVVPISSHASFMAGG